MAVALALLLAGCGSDQDPAVEAPEDGAGTTATTTAPAAEPATFELQLSGADEVPGPGDPDGTGSASVTVEPSLGEVVYDLDVTGIAAATAAHIHEAAAGQEGDVVVTLETPIEGSLQAATEVEDDLLARIAEDPASFYVNVHNDEFPDGAVRGQLG